MNRLFRYVLVVALLTSVPLPQVSAQVRYSSQFSNTGAPAHFNRARFSYASPQNLFTVYKRGVSPFGNDREVKIACSVDSGRTWTEHDISYLGAASTDMPLVAATSTGVLCAHHFQDSTGQSRVRFWWSYDNGNSFQCRTELERNLVQDFWQDSSFLRYVASTLW